MVILCVLCSVVSAQAQAADKAEPARSPAKSALIIDRGHTALLVMDYQNDIVAMVPEAARAPLLEKAGEVIKAARHAHLPIIYVVVRFRDGYPEVSRQNKRFAMLKESGRLREGTPGAEIHVGVAPEKGGHRRDQTAGRRVLDHGSRAHLACERYQYAGDVRHSHQRSHLVDRPLGRRHGLPYGRGVGRVCRHGQ
jgi:hypothetical protein